MEAKGLVRFIEMYFMNAKLRMVEPGSYKKSEFEGETKILWRQLSPERDSSLSVALKIGNSVEASIGNIDLEDTSHLALYSRIVDRIHELVFTYFQNLKT